MSSEFSRSVAQAIRCWRWSRRLRSAPAARCFGPCPRRRRRPSRSKRRRPPELPKPAATHRFEIDADSGDVVGYVQKTVVGKEDTLPDIARRFDVGYEEMLLANPGVDPGCRASGARSWCRRNSCCPRRRTKAWW